MILSFRGETTKDIYDGVMSKQALKIPRELWALARRKLDLLNAASGTVDLMTPPANRLERLKGKLSAYHSIRINDRYRVAFQWSGRDAQNVQIVDYH